LELGAAAPLNAVAAPAAAVAALAPPPNEETAAPGPTAEHFPHASHTLPRSITAPKAAASWELMDPWVEYHDYLDDPNYKWAGVGSTAPLSGNMPRPEAPRRLASPPDRSVGWEVRR
jgi:hypothetical protein